MINLLIVDDEVFTREGIVEILPLKDLGIENIKQAFDGVDALEISADFKPDILLTDVRMPRMNGIDLSFEIRKKYPDCSIIFMSGYSDKEYLKSAIELKAISYVEKPLEFDELETALKNAVSENLKSKTIAYNIKNSLALKMTNPKDILKIEDTINSCMPPSIKSIVHESSCLTVLISIESSIESIVLSELDKICILYNIYCLISKKEDNTLVMQLFFNKKYSDLNFLIPLLTSIGEYISKYSKFYICIGKIVSSIKDIYLSFIEADSLMKYKFFYDYDSIISTDKNILTNYETKDYLFNEFEHSLEEQNKQTLILLVKHLTLSFKENKATSISYIKDTYYRLILLAVTFIKNKNIDMKNDIANDNILEIILKCPNLYILEKQITDFIENIFTLLENTHKNKLPVFSVLDYIHKHYSDPQLCLDQISKNTFLTPTYICVIFKEHTSITVNKYITEYRIKKAKTLLKDSNVKMSDIAEKVGYSDANYFSKIFRKSTSSTPSEYRRNFIK